VWDNLATVHYGVNDFDEPRVFHRVMVQGPVLPERVTRWPDQTDGRPRTLVRADGSSGTVGAMTERLWPSDRTN
jgi:hypothetical protein